jgi:parallel beta-helix repeat protein
MLSWLSQAVRVGPQCELKTIEEGVEAARGKQEEIEADGADLMEGSMLVLVEPGVYEEGLKVDGGQRVSIWRCDRESESNKKEMAKLEWRSRDEEVLIMVGGSSVSVNGMHMSALKSEGYDGGRFNCVDADGAATLSLELCDLTCECDYSVVQISDAGSAVTISGCCIHDGKSNGVAIYKGASVTLENNNIHLNTEDGVAVQDEGSEVVLRGNSIHDGKETGVRILKGASATLDNNTITDNDLAGVIIEDHATATLTDNTIKGNGECQIERTEEELAEWPEDMLALYHSTGLPGIHVFDHSTITMPPGSNTIEGNGKVGSDGEQVVVDETSNVN